MGQPYFTRDGLAFLHELKSHNNKEWFEANRSRYEAGLRQPALQLIADLAPVLAKISPNFLADPKPTGGSLSRLNRDTRFAKDKRPYKTGLFLRFHHREGSAEASPGFYLHVGPGDTRIGGGVWRPAAAPLRGIREAIVDKPAAWGVALAAIRARGPQFTMIGEQLKTVPRGFPPGHEFADDLRRKDFGASWAIPDAVVLGETLLGETAKSFKALAPFVAFITEAAGLEA